MKLRIRTASGQTYIFKDPAIDRDGVEKATKRGWLWLIVKDDDGVEYFFAGDVLNNSVIQVIK